MGRTAALVTMASVALWCAGCSSTIASEPNPRDGAPGTIEVRGADATTIVDTTAVAGSPVTATTSPAAGTTAAPSTPASTSTSAEATTSETTTTATITATTTTTAATTGATRPPWPRTITMAFTGDTLPHSPLWRRAARNAEPGGGFDFSPMLVGLAPVLDEVDLAVCHLETPIAPVGEELSTSPFYGVPAEITDALAAAGYDRCSTASNHAADRGTAGVDRTVAALEAAGLGQSGMARTPGEIQPRVFDVDGIAVAHLSYTFSYNGLSFPDGESWRSATIDPVRIVTDARVARARGADVVVVSMHWGAEGVHAPTTSQRRIAEQITADGLIDLVVGHHAHVVQPIELVNDTWVMYGLGNVLSNLPTSSRWPAASQDSMLAVVSVAVGEDGAVEVSPPRVHPTWVDKDAGWVVRLVDRELARDDISAGQRGRLERSRARTLDVVGNEFLAVAVR